MTSPSKPVIITGNWKMYKTIEESLSFVRELLPLIQKSTARVYLAVPFTAIRPVSDLIKDTNICVGAQNMNDALEGAFTGEIAARMLKDAGAEFVILGHSERRRVFGETNEFINKKIKRALEDGLQPLVCVGETLQQREEGHVEQVLREQLTGCLAGIERDEAQRLIIAYEPVWAIGSDTAATPSIAEEAHEICRKILEELWGQETARQIVLQYGGSVKPDNAKSFIDQPNIDGLLVGGSSLSPETFSRIVNYHEVLVK